MDEQISTPYVDWDYQLITSEGAWDDGFRPRSTRDKYPSPGSGWHIEFRGQTRGGELLLANYHPSDDEDAGEWLNAFASESLGRVPVSIDTYFGPQSDPDDSDDPQGDPDPPDGVLRDVEHIIFIGHGWASWERKRLVVALPPEVFRDAAPSLLSDFRSEYASVEQRVFRLFTHIDASSFDGFLSTLETMELIPQVDKCEIRRPRRATYTQDKLSPDQMISVLRLPDGLVSHRQLCWYLWSESREVKGWLGQAGLLENAPRRLTGALYSSSAIRKQFGPWLKKNKPTPGCVQFVIDLITNRLINR